MVEEKIRLRARVEELAKELALKKAHIESLAQ